MRLCIANNLSVFQNYRRAWETQVAGPTPRLSGPRMKPSELILSSPQVEGAAAPGPDSENPWCLG